MFRLPETWGAVEAVEDEIRVGGLGVFRSGVSVRAPTGEEICGAAAAPAASASARAWFELLERVSTLEATDRAEVSLPVQDAQGRTQKHVPRATVFAESGDPGRWRFARSNGVALHEGWATACQRAFFELVERDRILRSWYGDIAPARLDVPGSSPLRKVPGFEWCGVSFPRSETPRSRVAAGRDLDVEVVGVFGFPREAGLPYVLGFGARGSLAAAVEAATAEAVQMLAFLWGEPLPDEPVPFAPTAAFHLDHHQSAESERRIVRWLEGEHRCYAEGSTRAVFTDDVGFVDLSPTWLPPGLRVVKAVSASAVPLTFGDSPYGAHLPAALRWHPIA